MNTQLRVYKGKCATMRLTSILNAGMTTNTTALTDEQNTYYALTYITSPGDAVFQAAVEWLGAKVRTDSDVLRLNEFHHQAGCIQHIIHRKWCYCVRT